MKANVQDPSGDAGKALERLIEDVGLKIHLAGMDVVSAWESLEPDVDALRASLRRSRAKRRAKKGSPVSMAVDEVELQAHLAAMEAGERWEAIERRLGPILEHLEGAGRSLAGAAGVAEAEGKARREEAARSRAAAKQELRQAGDHLKAAAADGIAIVRDALDSITKRLSAAGERPQPGA